MALHYGSEEVDDVIYSSFTIAFNRCISSVRWLPILLSVVTLRVRTVAKKTYEIFHVYCICNSGLMCQTTVIFGITKDGSLVLNTLASGNCFICRNLFQNGANDMSECLTCETAFRKKARNFV